MAREAGWLLLGATTLLILMGRAVGYAVKTGAAVPVTPEMQYALAVVVRVWSRYGSMATVTSGTDGEHGTDSLHYLGLALDIRTKDIPVRKDKLAMIADVRAILGRDYDVLLEDDGRPNEHLHIEYDPR